MKSPYYLLSGYLLKGIVPINKTSCILVSPGEMITELFHFPLSFESSGVTFRCAALCSARVGHKDQIVTLKWVFLN
jgi:hypothetical protein